MLASPSKRCARGLLHATGQTGHRASVTSEGLERAARGEEPRTAPGLAAVHAAPAAVPVLTPLPLAP